MLSYANIVQIASMQSSVESDKCLYEPRILGSLFCLLLFWSAKKATDMPGLIFWMPPETKPLKASQSHFT